MDRFQLSFPMSRYDPTILHGTPCRLSYGQQGVLPFHSSFRIRLSAFFSNRDTCAWEIPTSADTSIWVFPWKNRRAKIRRSRSRSEEHTSELQSQLS